MSADDAKQRKSLMAWLKPALRIALLLVLIVVMLSTETCHNTLFLHPSRTYDKMPAERGLKFEQVSFANSNGKKLCGWYFPAPGAIGAVVLNHGNSGNMSLYLDYAEMLGKAGVSLLLYDYQGFGQSEKGTSLRGLVPDALAAYDYLASRGQAPGGIAVMGVSLGTPVSCGVAAQRPEAKALILEGAFLPTDELYHHMGTLGWPAAFVVSKTMPKMNPQMDVQCLAGRPLLMVHGSDDATTPITGAARLFEAASQPKWMWVMDNVGHFPDPTLRKGKGYQQVLASFLRHVFLKDEFAQPYAVWSTEQSETGSWFTEAVVMDNGDDAGADPVSIVVTANDGQTARKQVRLDSEEQRPGPQAGRRPPVVLETRKRPVSVSVFAEPQAAPPAGDTK